MRLVSGCALGLAGAVALASAAACSLTSNFDGIVGTRPADAGDEATDDGGDEGGSSGDAGSDGAVNCETEVHLLCRNFDHGVLTQGGWMIQTAGGGTVQLDVTQFVSPPASFHSKTPSALDGGAVGGILLQTVNVGPYKAIRFGFDARIAACGGTGSTTLMALQVSTATAFGIVLVDQTSTFSQLMLDQGSLFLPHILPELPTGRWFRIDVRLELSASVAKGVVSLDGKPILTDTFEARQPAEAVNFNIGVNAAGPVNACDVAYDNVTLDKE